MVDTTFGAAGVIQPAEVKDVELYHPKSWVTKYVFCQDAKVIAIQYSITALSIGLVALVLSWLIRPSRAASPPSPPETTCNSSPCTA
jgi:cytochrome c oxidase subunit 1